MPIKTKLAAVTRKNNDGVSRQELLREVKHRGDQHVTLEHEENNTYSDHAVAVYDIHGKQLGYLKDDLATDIAGRIKGQAPAKAKILDIGGDPLECEIEIPFDKKAEEKTKMKEALNGWGWM